MWTCTDSSPLRVRTTLPVAPTQSPSDSLAKASKSPVIFCEREELDLARRVAQGGEGQPPLGAHQHDPPRHGDDVVALLPGPERGVPVVQRAGFGAFGRTSRGRRPRAATLPARRRRPRPVPTPSSRRLGVALVDEAQPVQREPRLAVLDGRATAGR